MQVHVAGGSRYRRRELCTDRSAGREGDRGVGEIAPARLVVGIADVVLKPGGLTGEREWHAIGAEVYGIVAEVPIDVVVVLIGDVTIQRGCGPVGDRGFRTEDVHVVTGGRRGANDGQSALLGALRLSPLVVDKGAGGEREVG